MNKLRGIEKQQIVSLSSVVILVFAALAPAVTPVQVSADSQAAGLSPGMSQVLPAWWRAALEPSSEQAAAPESYRALPAWWPPKGPVGAPQARPALNPANRIQIEDGLDTEVITATLTAGENMTFYAIGYQDSLSEGETTVTWTLSFDGASPVQSRGTFTTFDATTVGTGVLTADLDASISATARITVNAGSASAFHISPTVISAQTAGADFPLDIEARDTFGNVADGYNGTAALNDTTGTRGPASLQFNLGVWSGVVSITQTASDVVITVTDGLTTGSSDIFAVQPAELDRFAMGAVDPTQVAGADFSLTITAFDAWDNLKTDYSGPPTLADTTGFIAPSQTTCSWATGVCNQTVNITRALDNNQITVSDPGGVFVTSNAFAVGPAALDHIRVNSAPNNGGQDSGGPVEVTTHDMDIYQTYTAWAAGYDEFDNYIEDVTADWGATGVLANGVLAPNPGISTTFTPAPVLSGTGFITAAIGPGVEDSTDLFHVRAPRIEITKTGTPNPVSAGGSLGYEIEFYNLGNAPAQTVIVTETYDTNVSFDYATVSPSLGDNVWIFSQDSRTFFVAVNVDNSLEPGTVLTNVVTVGGPLLSSYTFTEVTEVTSAPDLTVTLSANAAFVDAGDNLVYAIGYANDGNAPVSNMIITMVYDADVSVLNTNYPPGLTETRDDDASTITWSSSTLGAGQSGDIFVTVEVNELMPDEDILRTDVAINSDDTDEFTDFELTIVRAPVLALTKSANPSPVQAFSSLTFTLHYTNEGSTSSEEVFLTDTIPSNTGFVFGSCVPGCQFLGDMVQWNLGTLTPDENGTTSFRVDVDNNLDDGTPLVNRAGLRALYGYTATAVLTTLVESAPILTVTKSANVEPARVTDELIYTLRYANVGNGPAYGVVMTDILPSDVTYLSGCNFGDGCVVDGQVLTWNRGTVAAGSARQFVLRVLVNAPLPDQALLTNSVVISAATRTRATSLLTTTVIAPELALAVTDDPDPVQASALLTYSIAYTNSGEGYAGSVILTATLPDNTTFYDCQPAGCGLVGGDVIQWNLGQVAGNSNGQASLVVKVDNNLDSGTVLAQVAGIEAEAEAVSAFVELTTTVLSQPVFSIEMRNGHSLVEAGDRVTYTLEYGNEGNANAYDTTILFSVPDLPFVDYVTCLPAPQCNRAGNTVTYDLGTVPGGDGGTLKVVVEVADPLPAGANTNHVVAHALITATPDPAGDTTAEDVDEIATRPDLEVDVDYSSHTPYPGKRLTYSVQYRNSGHIATDGVVVTVNPPAFTTYDGAGSDAWQSLPDGSYFYEVGPLDYDQGGSLLFVVILPTPTFTRAMTNFDASFGIYDSGVSLEDGDPDDNTQAAPIGVPDIVVDSVDVNWRSMLSGEYGQHIIVTLKNLGSNVACNPVPPLQHEGDYCGGFWVDVYFNPDPIPVSCPSDNYYGELWVNDAIIITEELKIGFSFSTAELPRGKQNPSFLYVRADNLTADPERPYGSVPEYNECNNVFGPVEPPINIYLPLLLREP